MVEEKLHLHGETDADADAVTETEPFDIDSSPELIFSEPTETLHLRLESPPPPPAHNADDGRYVDCRHIYVVHIVALVLPPPGASSAAAFVSNRFT